MHEVIYGLVDKDGGAAEPYSLEYHVLVTFNMDRGMETDFIVVGNKKEKKAT